jgi:transcriptional regulator with XRE-family HTH domain
MVIVKERYRRGKMDYLESGIPTRLKKVRNDIRKTQKDMAGLIDVSQPYYSGLEEGKRILNASMLKKLSENGISADFMLTGKGEYLNGESKYSENSFKTITEELEKQKALNEILLKHIMKLKEDI